jgi:hypothetical protein
MFEFINLRNNDVSNYKVNKIANPSFLNLSELLLPSIQLFKNNQGGDSIRYENCNDVRSILTRIKNKKANLCKGRNIELLLRIN